MDLCLRSDRPHGLSDAELESGLIRLLEKYSVKKVLIIPPDYTRIYSNAGFITHVCYRCFTGAGARVDILPALGTHVPMTSDEINDMYHGIPLECFIEHHWRSDVIKLGSIPASYMSDITQGLWTESVSVQVNKLVLDESYDLIISVGQVLPHEVVGMANHAKNLFVGVGGADMINKSHMVGALFGMERMMGRDHTPVRAMFDYAYETFLKQRPVLFMLTVASAPDGIIATHGLFCGRERDTLEAAVKLSQEKNITYIDAGIQKCVVYLNPDEFKSTWIGNKAIYRTRMAIADGGELIVLAPGVQRFGEDKLVDSLIRKYGYRGKQTILDAFRHTESEDLRANMSAAAHLVHGSTDGRFSVTYAVQNISQDAIESVGFQAACYHALASQYPPDKLSYGINILPDGEVIYYIPNPALGLWVQRGVTI
ncbi:MAG: lactate racemase domain-containing protein [Clostridia bacterium]|nr:lactate racemase domain-containing protein [Clostridia bacterium]